MLVDDKSLGEVENWVKLHNEAVPKYDTYLEEIDTRLNCKVKLPKFFITKFNGTHLYWFRFWNQFESDIEISELSPGQNFLT